MASSSLRNHMIDRELKFSNILGSIEMIEGCPPFSTKLETEIPKAYAANERPPFRAPAKHYAHGLRDLIEECWNEKPAKRPPFRVIIARLEAIKNRLIHKSRWKVRVIKPLRCFHNLEAKLRRENSDLGSHSTRSTID